jgi:hypothetical protein
MDQSSFLAQILQDRELEDLQTLRECPVEEVTIDTAKGATLHARTRIDDEDDEDDEGEHDEPPSRRDRHRP